MKCEHCEGTGEAPDGALPRIPYFATFEEFKAWALPPRKSFPCMRCKKPETKSVVSCTSSGVFTVTMILMCDGCGAHSKEVNLRPIFELAQLWGVEIVPETMVRHLLDIVRS